MKRPVCEQYTQQDHPMGNAENILQYYKYNIYIYIGMGKSFVPM